MLTGTLRWLILMISSSLNTGVFRSAPANLVSCVWGGGGVGFQVYGKNASDPEYLNWLFSSEGALKDPMDYGQFVYVAHQYMVYMRRTFGIECMVCVIG